MGAYLSEPVTEKYSSDEGNDYMDVGASSMQGWRISQEDAHNCILKFDENTSFFSVYDGHGGAEVAAYCAENLPEFLKHLKAYKDGNFDQALKDAFLGFDGILLEEDVIEILKKLAVEKNPDRDSELADEEEEEDLVELCQEGCLPIEEVLEKYKGCAGRFPQLIRLKKEDGGASGSGTSKPLSPFLRGRRNPVMEICEEITEESEGPSSSSVTTHKLNIECKMNIDNVESTVSSSSSKSTNCTSAEAVGVEVSAGTTTTTTTTASKVEDSDNKSNVEQHSKDSVEISNSTNVGIPLVNKVQNGDISSCQDKDDEPPSSSGKNEDVSSSSCASSSDALLEVPSTNHKNGEVSSLTSPTPVNKVKQSAGSSSSGNITSSTNDERNQKSHNVSGLHDGEEDTSSSDDDADFHAEDNSSTEDGDEDGEQVDEDSEEENEDEETEDEDGGIEDAFCASATEEPGKDSGCTAVVALLHGRDLYVANAGDSRCVVCRNGKAVEMSQDHKPEDDEERMRIVKAGGKVTVDGRVNGGLNLSRAIGDHSYKMNKELPPEAQMISALPDVRKLVISSDDEFMILACDGIWNFMSSDDVVEFVRERISAGQEKMSVICEELFDNCLAPNTMGDGTGCDNMTAVIVRFKPKILDLPTRITDEIETTQTTVTSSKRRCSSPITQSESDESSENSNKRLKTDGEIVEKDILLQRLV